MARVSDEIWGWLGWCPMLAAPRYPPRGAAGVAGDKDTTGDGGPVARRSARFMRMAWGVVALSWVVAFLALPYLPEIIPVHWNVYGEADGFSGRIFGAFGLPAIITLIMALLMILPRYDSVQVSLDAFRDIYAMMLFSVVSLFFCIEVVALANAAGSGLPVSVIFPVLIGALFIVMGALMPHIGRNTTMGIRLPWTVRDDRVWKKTHEHAGPLFIAGGVLIVFGSLVGRTWAMAVMAVVTIGLVLYISVWSYRLARARPLGE
ncbi:MAG: hypothetical protein A4E35_01510 [Methanoregula sp. PtaU1.Bin051]|nr:MAG: hypothetical protein A4E35_01510 [Methanoregula sp. PtaU1.Bin051]